ncbi:MAG: cyclic pyranopterin monophosphate synthase MoaC [Gemmatimonadota bacterium]
MPHEPGPGPTELTHVTASGEAHMVDVTDKAHTQRSAVAEGHIRMSAEALERVIRGDGRKGEVLGVARLAGIMGGKRTADLIPLCHALPETSFEVEVHPDTTLPGVRVRTTARVAGRTGVEMEALMATGVALLTIYDMVKAVDRGMEIGGVRLIEKTGGRSGHWTATQG